MKQFKKLLALTLSLAMALPMASCGNNSAPGNVGGSSANQPGSTSGVSSSNGTQSSYPNGTISFIVPYAAGDGLDTSTRAMLENADFPVSTLVENISGGSGTIGLQDWEILTFTTAPVLSVLGCTSSKDIKNSDDMKAFLESDEQFTVGVPSMSGFGYVSASAMFDQMNIMDHVTWVSYDGAPALYQAYLSGEIDFAVFDDNFAAQYAQAGDDITIGVVINDVRSQYFPDVAAAGEWGIEGLGANIGFKAAAVKKGTPADVCAYLTEKINAAVVSEGYQKWCEDNFFGVLSTEDIYTGEEAMSMLLALRETNRTVLTAAGLL